MAAPAQLNGLIPVTGSAHADYLGDHRHLDIAQADENTPAIHVQASGLLTLFTKDLNSNLRLDVTGHDLGELDRLLSDLDLRVTPKSEPNDLPVKLLGPATFHGSVHGGFYFRVEAADHVFFRQAELQSFDISIQRGGGVIWNWLWHTCGISRINST